MDAVMIEAGPLDGRTARRHRNRTAVLDAVVELFDEDNLTPGVHDVARRSGVSLRSVYRYFEDVDDLVSAAIARHVERSDRLFDIPGIGVGPTSDRIQRFCTSRVAFFTAVRPVYRASTVRASQHRHLADALDSGRERLKDQTEAMFRPELDARDQPHRRTTASMLDTLSQFESLEYQYRSRSHDPARTAQDLTAAFGEILR